MEINEPSRKSGGRPANSAFGGELSRVTLFRQEVSMISIDRSVFEKQGCEGISRKKKFAIKSFT